jgi:hypothetical protein
MERPAEKTSLEQLEKYLDRSREVLIFSVKIKNTPGTVNLCREAHTEALQRYEKAYYDDVFSRKRDFFVALGIYLENFPPHMTERRNQDV